MAIHDKEYLLKEYYIVKEKEEKETDRLLKAIRRDEMRKIERILFQKYKITIDK